MTGLMHEKEFSRKTFVKGGGALVVGFSLAAAAAGKAQAYQETPFLGATGNTPFDDRGPQDFLPDLNSIDAWIAITADNKLIVTTGETELGHGTPTGILMLVAEELNMPPEFGLSTTPGAQVIWAHPETWLNATGGGGGSGGIDSRATQARAAAAYAMQLLLGMAAAKFNLPVTSLTAANGTITGGGQSVTYGELIGGQNFNYEMPVTQQSAIPGQGVAKPVSEYTIVGKSFPRIDIPNKVTGDYTYIQNVRIPGMVHARIVRPRGRGANTVENDIPLSVDASSIASIPDAEVVQIANLLAVVAPREYDAIQAAAQLKVEWQTAQGFPQPSSNYWSWLREAGDTNTETPARYTSQLGNPAAALATAATTVSATYHYHYNQFAPIGPHAAVADVQENSAVIYAQGQSLSGIPTGLSPLLNIPAPNIRVIWYEGASSFGGGFSGECAEQAAVISQKIGKPVRMQWMRWDQNGWDHWGMANLWDVTMGADANGNIIAANWQTYGQQQANIDETQRLMGLKTWPAVPGAGGIAPSDTAVYNTTHFANHWALAKSQPLYGGSINCNYLRAPSAPQSYFASEQIVDELAHAAGMDPIAFRMQNIDGTTDQGSTIGVLGARWLSVLAAASEAAGWQPRVANSIKQTGVIRSGRGFGFGTFASSQMGIVADIQVNMKSGLITPKHLWIAQNNGITMGPQLVANQMSGAAIQGLSRALWEEATWNTERLTTLDWVTYPILRFSQAPSVTLINVHPGQYTTVIPGDFTTATNPGTDVSAGNTSAFNEGWVATGSGEPPTSAIGSAIANAFFDATGARIRQSPMTPANCRGALQAAGVLM